MVSSIWLLFSLVRQFCLLFGVFNLLTFRIFVWNPFMKELNFKLRYNSCTLKCTTVRWQLWRMLTWCNPSSSKAKAVSLTHPWLLGLFLPFSGLECEPLHLSGSFRQKLFTALSFLVPIHEIKEGCRPCSWFLLYLLSVILSGSEMVTSSK